MFRIICGFISLWFLLPAEKTIAQERTILAVGDAAPPITALKWLKGKKVTQFEKDKIYILEFGFVSCAPCRESIPHLSDIATKYKDKVELISFFIWENGRNPIDTVSTEYVAHVRRFIQAMGDKIKYTVAIDDPKQSMANSWMKGRTYAPEVFVVNGEGKILWIGSPFKLDAVVRDVNNNTFSPEEQYKAQIDGQQYDSALLKIYEHTARGEPGRALLLVDSLIKMDSGNKFLLLDKFKILQQMDPSRAYRFADNLLKNELHDSEPVLFKLSVDVIHPPYKNVPPDYELGISIVNRALELSNHISLSALLTKDLAYAFFKTGKTEKAINTLKEFLRIYERNDQKDTRIIEILKEHIKYFQEG